MSPQTDAERELAQLLVESLNLEEVEPGSIDPEAPLFNTGLGLDSIDALELALAISKRHGFQLRSDNDRSEEHTSELQSLMRTSYAVFCLKKNKHKNTHKA